MARRYNKRYSQKRGKSRGYRKNNSARELTKLAYQLGQIERGKKNPDSRISESFNRGATAPQKRERKPLF